MGPVAASDIDLTTVAAVAAYIGGVDASDQAINDLLQTLVTSASAFAANYCSRDFRKQTYTQSYNGTGTSTLMLRAAPVSAVSSLSIEGTSVAAAVNGAACYGYVFDDAGVVYLRGPYAFPMGAQNVTVTYAAGWVTPGQNAITPATATTLPMDIQQAVIELVSVKYKAQRNNIGISARMIAGETISYSQRDMPPSTKSVFDIYQRVGVSA